MAARNNSFEDYNSGIYSNKSDIYLPPKIEKTKLPKEGNKNLILILAACIGRFIRFVLTSLVVLCCNPSEKLRTKQKVYLCTTISIRIVFNDIYFEVISKRTEQTPNNFFFYIIF